VFDVFSLKLVHGSNAITQFLPASLDPLWNLNEGELQIGADAIDGPASSLHTKQP